MKREQIDRLKHNARLDVRLPDQLKDEFLARCREEGVSSGAVIRALMIDYLTRPRRLSDMAAGLKESLMKRSKWIVGGVGGSVATGLAAMSLVYAPAATADDMRVDYLLRVNIDGEMQSFSNQLDLGLGDGWVSYPLTEAGEVAVQLIVLPRRCDEEALSLDPNCEVAFQLHITGVTAYDRDETGKVTVLESTHIVSFNLFGRLGEPMNYAQFNNGDAPSLSIQVQASPV